jgi:hypothetical protein
MRILLTNTARLILSGEAAVDNRPRAALCNQLQNEIVMS